MLPVPVSPSGEVLDRKFRIERIIGTGGMGVVMTARHVELGRRVAIKFMLPQVADDPANAERFAREARAAVQLRSQYAGRVLDVGRKGDAPYMVMEFLEGQDLDDVVRVGGALPYPVAVQYVLQACEAIAEAHALGIVHRDLKPKNIFLTRTASGDACVKVLDFGLAKVGDGEGKNMALTTTGSVFGSSQYMSPEQLRSTKGVDGATDIWALGVTLYELLTAVLPFNGGTVPEIGAAVLKEAPQPPSDLAPDMPSELEQVVLRCLEKEPARRFANVIDLAFALQPFASETGLAAKAKYVADAAARRMIDSVPEPAEPPPLESKTVRLHPKRDRPSWLVPAALAAGVSVCVHAVALKIGSWQSPKQLAETSAPSQSQAPVAAVPVLPPPVAIEKAAPAASPSAASPRRQPAASCSRRPASGPPSSAPAPTTSGPLMVSP